MADLGVKFVFFFAAERTKWRSGFNDSVHILSTDCTEKWILFLGKLRRAKKTVSRLHAHTPDRNKAQFSPASYSPISASKKADADGPNNSGNVVYTFGNASLLKQTTWSTRDTTSSTSGKRPLSIEVRTFKGTQLTPEEDNTGKELPNCLGNECKYMYDSSYDRVLILGDRIYEGGREICQGIRDLRRQRLLMKLIGLAEGNEEDSIPKDDREACVVEEVAIHHVDYPSTELITVMGRIVTHPERKTDRIAIVDFDEMTLRYTKLDLSKVKSWSLFPGQTVVLEGINPRGNAFEVATIHTQRKLEKPLNPIHLEKGISMVIGSAPFTDKDDLLYEKLSDLLAYCSENSPDVLILTGPFGDASSPLFSTIAEPFEEYFEKIITNIMQSVPPSTEVFIVSNHDDIVSMFVYPSFPHKINKYFKNLHFLPDPCVLSINGVEIGVTTVDVIKDLADAELSENPIGDKIKRAFKYLFYHKTFYPLNPPPEYLPLDVDLLNEFGKLPRIPNMMICPGDLKCYVRDVDGCVCINPGHLVDHATGEGTFARVVVYPPESSSITVFNFTVSQVVKS
ncbi:DNA polymerase alpha subunit B isoform X2 [Toxorhynchites rutilus septentrionalis]|uniref:DNA polymerase alpha subunit B isoform X2 n=1 Tax=Toxorhynchites rutilus septentrionalis TaxID=329112 RepID=UPI00247AAA59|nr:DNA polymerase alpha subunit B isoform X2 [Toxorhynchites rutilus septentrionalis]